MIEFDMTLFDGVRVTNLSPRTLYTHVLQKGSFDNERGRVWICKEISHPAHARSECLAQELFRLFVPHQPETRLGINPHTNTYFILSEEIPNYTNLPVKQQHNFANGHFTGLGEIMVLALFLDETDFKNGNVVLNEFNQVVKFDGDWCFTSLRNKKKSVPIATDAIEKLPACPSSSMTNWLDFVVCEKNEETGIVTRRTNLDHQIVHMKLARSPHFCREINNALLKISLIPDTYLQFFVDAFIPAGGEAHLRVLQERRDQLKAIALKTSSFMEYLNTEEAKSCLSNFIKQLETFTVSGKKLAYTRPDLIPTEVYKRCHDFTALLHSPLKQQCLDLLEQVRAYHKTYKDTLFFEYRRECKALILAYAANEKELLIIQQELLLTLKSLQSHEIAAIYEYIALLRQKSVGFFSFDKNPKADQIEQALFVTPLQERGTVLSCEEDNAVKKALAQHVGLGVKGMVYYTKDKKIDFARAGKGYQSLISKFDSQPSLPQPSLGGS